jgi:hypothetical protein
MIPRLPVSGLLEVSVGENMALHELAACRREKKASAKADHRWWGLVGKPGRISAFAGPLLVVGVRRARRSTFLSEEEV